LIEFGYSIKQNTGKKEFNSHPKHYHNISATF